MRLYEKRGAYPDWLESVVGTRFAVWASNALRVSVVGDFNFWDGRRHPMRRRLELGVWEISLPEVTPGAPYTYEIVGPHGELRPLKADPFAFRAELPPKTASLVHGLLRHEWRNAAWMDRRGPGSDRSAPIAISECHSLSWRRVAEEGQPLAQLAGTRGELVPYVAHMGFTHIEVLPISEYPFEDPWGYQPIGLDAPISRHGTAADSIEFAEAAHAAGLGALIDWVPAHFPNDPHRIARFDGTALYAHEDPRKGWPPDWRTLIYTGGRAEVANSLDANAQGWLHRYHVDGLRVDAVVLMLYLDYSPRSGEWVPNAYGGNENLEAIAFLRRVNESVFGRHEGATTVAEKSTASPMVSRPTWLGGLGFAYKWNMVWMHDTLRYMSSNPLFRRYWHGDLTFGLLYAFSETFVLPLSYDRSGARQGIVDRPPARRPLAEIRQSLGLFRLHVNPSRQKAALHGGRMGTGARVGLCPEPRPAPAR